jgi:chaperonin GroEL
MNVGAHTDTERIEKKFRIDDAICATRAAIEEGIIPGGGIGLLRCREALMSIPALNEDEHKGIDIIRMALLAPIKQILINSGLEVSTENLLAKLLSFPIDNDFGYNAKTDEFENFFETGIIDPCKVARVALENAASVGSMFLLTECAISEE